MTETKRKISGKADASRISAKGLEAMLEYAIVEGAELRLPLFVGLLRLARLALKEKMEDGPAPKH